MLSGKARVVTLISRSERDTFEAGKRLGMLLKRRSEAVLCIYGELGAGKTLLIKGIGTSLGIPERDIGSASFVLAQQYRTEPPFNHLDLYRLKDVEEEEWIWDYIGRGITAIEWAERLPEAPSGAIKVHIKIKDKNEREISIEGINQEDWDNIQTEET